MHTSLLLNSRTVPSVSRDFVEWHRGIPQYGFWAIVVHDPDWLELWNKAHTHVKRFIHEDYQRTPHVTIAACGLMHSDHFSEEQLRRQSQVLEDAGITPFHLKINPTLDSFTTAPVLMIEDPAGAIEQIRGRLGSVATDDDAAPEYRPHITIGLYRDAFDTREVSECLASFMFPFTKPLRVTRLSFCVYQTRDIQGRFEILRNIRLDAK